MEQNASPESGSSLDRAIDLLFHLHDSEGPQGVTAIGRALGLPKSSVHRLATGLVDRTLLERDERGRLRPGPGLIALGLGSLARDPVVALARPSLEAEARTLGETSFLVAARGRSLIVLDKAEGSGFLRAAPTVGQEVPLHATAVGKLFRAHAAEAVELDPAAARFTERTLDAVDFAEAVERARVLGFAESHGEWVEGLSVVAAPVFGAQHRLVAAFAIAGTTPRIRALGAEAPRRALSAARTIGEQICGTNARRRRA